MLFLGHWNCKHQPNTRVILLCSIVWCLVIPNTMVSNWLNAIHFQQKDFMAVITWTLSWIGSLVSITIVMDKPPGINNNTFFCVARYCLVCTGFAPVLSICCNWHWIQVLQLCTSVDTGNIWLSWEGNYINYMNYSNYACYVYYIFYTFYAFQVTRVGSFNLDGICLVSGPVQAWLQETNSLCHPHWKYHGKTACHFCWWHWNHSAPPGQPLSQTAWWPAALCQWQMQDVVCQVMGIGMVLQYVIKTNGVEGTVLHGVQHGEVMLLYQLFQFE